VVRVVVVGLMGRRLVRVVRVLRVRGLLVVRGFSMRVVGVVVLGVLVRLACSTWVRMVVRGWWCRRAVCR
jgi:hypothetical protein